MSNKPKFDPSQPFEDVVEEPKAKPKFDPNQPFEDVSEESQSTQASGGDKPERGILEGTWEKVKGFPEAIGNIPGQINNAIDEFKADPIQSGRAFLKEGVNRITSGQLKSMSADFDARRDKYLQGKNYEEALAARQAEQDEPAKQNPSSAGLGKLAGTVATGVATSGLGGVGTAANLLGTGALLEAQAQAADGTFNLKEGVENVLAGGAAGGILKTGGIVKNAAKHLPGKATQYLTKKLADGTQRSLPADQAAAMSQIRNSPTYMDDFAHGPKNAARNATNLVDDAEAAANLKNTQIKTDAQNTIAKMKSDNALKIAQTKKKLDVASSELDALKRNTVKKNVRRAGNKFFAINNKVDGVFKELGDQRREVFASRAGQPNTGAMTGVLEDIQTAAKEIENLDGYRSTKLLGLADEVKARVEDVALQSPDYLDLVDSYKFKQMSLEPEAFAKIPAPDPFKFGMKIMDGAEEAALVHKTTTDLGYLGQFDNTQKTTSGSRTMDRTYRKLRETVSRMPDAEILQDITKEFHKGYKLKDAVESWGAKRVVGTNSKREFIADPDKLSGGVSSFDEANQIKKIVKGFGDSKTVLPGTVDDLDLLGRIKQADPADLPKILMEIDPQIKLKQTQIDQLKRMLDADSTIPQIDDLVQGKLIDPQVAQQYKNIKMLSGTPEAAPILTALAGSLGTVVGGGLGFLTGGPIGATVGAGTGAGIGRNIVRTMADPLKVMSKEVTGKRIGNATGAALEESIYGVNSPLVQRVTKSYPVIRDSDKDAVFSKFRSNPRAVGWLKIVSKQSPNKPIPRDVITSASQKFKLPPQEIEEALKSLGMTVSP